MTSVCRSDTNYVTQVSTMDLAALGDCELGPRTAIVVL